MAVFDERDESTYERLDWRILQNGWSALIREPAALDQCVAWFEQAGYRVVEFDCHRWPGEEAMHSELAAKLYFPSYYGRNLDALTDCLSSIQLAEPGLVVVLRNFEAMPADSHPLPYQLLDVLANASRMHLLFGRRLLTLVQINKEDTDFDLVGGCAVPWLSR